MKIILISLLLTCFFFTCNSNSVNRKTTLKQNINHVKDTCCFPVHITEENVLVPEFIGGEDSLNSYIKNKLNNFSTTKYSDFVFLTFTITPNGTIENIKIVKEVEGCSLCQTKAEEIVKMMPNWIPAYRTDNKKNRLNPIKWEQSLEIEF